MKINELDNLNKIVQRMQEDLSYYYDDLVEWMREDDAEKREIDDCEWYQQIVAIYEAMYGKTLEL